jgi:HemX protein
MERIYLSASTVFFFLGFAYTMYALRARLLRPSRGTFVVMALGFILQTAFLQARGTTAGRCPLTNLFEVLVFLSWSIVLLYFVVGGTYRLSLLGAFTAPLVFLLQTTAQLLPSASIPVVYRKSAGVWPELHAALALMAYGAFALAFVASVMYLVQERLLKKHRLNSFFRTLPPIADLSTALQRVMLAGFVMLTVALFSGLMAGSPAYYKATMIVSCFVWAPYGGLLIFRRKRTCSPRQFAWLSAAAFLLALCTLGALSYLHISR